MLTTSIFRSGLPDFHDPCHLLLRRRRLRVHHLHLRHWLKVGSSSLTFLQCCSLWSNPSSACTCSKPTNSNKGCGSTTCTCTEYVQVPSDVFEPATYLEPFLTAASASPRSASAKRSALSAQRLITDADRRLVKAIVISENPMAHQCIRIL